MTSEKSMEHISLSSDNLNSSDKTIEFPESNSEEKPKEEKLIVISDSELEEGEIHDDDDHTDINKEKDKGTKSYIDYRRKYGETGTSKNKWSENYADEEFPPSNIKIPAEDFSWSDVRILMVGDERVLGFSWEEWTDFPLQHLYHLPNCDVNSMCLLTEKHLHKKYDIVFLIGFHYDFVCHVQDAQSDINNSSSVIDLKSSVNINEIIKTVQKFHYKWVKQYPYTNIIWSIPSPPDFLKYNSTLLKERGIDPEQQLVKKVQYTLSKDYFNLSRKLAKEWKEKIKYIPMFPINKVLFMKKQCYKKSFSDSAVPKFPRGYLRNGLTPTKMMAIYCAYLLVEFIIDEGFYPEGKIGLKLAEAEAKLVRLDPDVKNYLHSTERHTRKRSSQHSRHHNHRHKKYDDDSLSTLTSSGDSRSRSRSRRGRYRDRSNSRPRYRTRSDSTQRHRTRSKSREKYRLRSRSKDEHRTESVSSSRSLSRERPRGKDPKSKVSSHGRSKRHSHRRNFRSSSSSSSSSSLSISEHRKADASVDVGVTKGEKRSSDEVRRMNIKDEVSFWKALRDLRELHDIQCAMYRRKPHTHPLFAVEKDKFLKRFPLLSGEVAFFKWSQHWRQRIEEIFEESWVAKKEQITRDLNHKGSFSSLNNFPDLLKDSKNYTASTKDVLDERSKFKQENVETINSYLNELETTVDSTQSSTPGKAGNENPNLESKDFTLADIFRDCSASATKPLNNDTYSQCPRKRLSTVKDLPLPPLVDPSNANTPSPIDRLTPSDSDSESTDSIHSESIESDLDFDDLMENADFLKGLEEIDKELQNAVPPNGQLEEEDSKTIAHPKSPLADSPSVKVKDDKIKSIYSEEDLRSEFVNVLKMLFRVSKRLGPLGVAVSALYHRAAEDLRNASPKFPSLNSDSKSLLLLVNNKLNLFLKENLPQVQKAIYGEITDRLRILLDKIHVDHGKFQKVNIQSIATATLGQEVAQVVAFIKNTLLYHGYAHFTTDDVMNIYMSVKASQLDMEIS